MSELPIDVDAEAIFFDGGWYTREDLSRRIKAMLDSGDYNVARPSAALEQLTQTLGSVRTLVFRCTPNLAEALHQAAAKSGHSVGGVIRDAVSAYLSQLGAAPAGTSSGGPAAKPSVVPPASGASPWGPHGVVAASAPPASSPPTLASAAALKEPAPAAPSASSNSFSSLPVVIDVDDEEPKQQEPTIRRAIPMPPTGTTQDDLPKVIVEEQPMVIAGPGALANAGITRPPELARKAPEQKPDEAVSSEHRWFK
jgi:hypothetical protein